MERRKFVLSLSLVTGIIIILSSMMSSVGDPPEPPQFHYISGSALYGGLVIADGAHVRVINTATSEELTDIVGSLGNSHQSGWYRVNLMDFPSGFTPGDLIIIMINGTGPYQAWSGSRSTVVDDVTLSQIVHITLVGGHPPHAPQNLQPPLGAINVSINPILKVHISDPDGDVMDVEFYDARTDTRIGTVMNVANNSDVQIVWLGLMYSTTYEWYACVNDSVLETKSSSWSFTTRPPSPNIPPEASFTWTPISPTTNNVIYFTDYSSDPDGNLMSWSWEFGDGHSSFLQNPTHTYADNGVYHINLTVMDDQGNTTACSQSIHVSNSHPHANFTWASNFLTVTFSDTSLDSDGEITNWYWEFGDGATSIQQHPGHRYATPGFYPVFLVVTDNDGDQAQITQEVTISPLEAYLSVTITQPHEGDSLQGTITVKGTAHGNFTLTSVDIKVDAGAWHTAAGTTAWSYLWNTYDVENGQHIIYARSSDGEFYSTVASVMVDVANNHLPQVIMVEPADNTLVKGTVLIKGWASDQDGNGTLEMVRIRIDGGDWIPTLGTTTWLHELTTTNLTNGYHTLEVQAFDGQDYSEIVPVTIKVNNRDTVFGVDKSLVFGGLALLLACIAVLIIIAVIILLDRWVSSGKTTRARRRYNTQRP